MAKGLMSKVIWNSMTYEDWTNVIIACAITSASTSVSSKKRKELLRIANELNDRLGDFEKKYEED